MVYAASDQKSPADLDATAERVRRHIAECPVDIGTVQVSVTISLGLVCAIADGPDSLIPEDLVRAADAALYCAKANGRNRAEIAPMVSHAGTGGAPKSGTVNAKCTDVVKSMARWWASSGTEVLFPRMRRGFSLMGEQFWGRAARASNDSKESGRLLNFWALFQIRQLFREGADQR